jgi:putative inorganic carbon (hco3(-)) transporter
LLTIWALALSNILLGVGVLALWRVRGAVRPAAPGARAAGRLAAVYLLLLLAAIAASIDVGRSLKEASEIFSFAAFGLLLALVSGEREVRWLVDALILVGAGVALAGLGQFLLGYGALEQRIRGPFSHYMTFAGVLLLVDLLLVARLLARRRAADAAGPAQWLDRAPVAWGALLAINVALFASLTRSAWVALVAALALVVALVRPRLLLAAPLIALLFLVAAPRPVVARALSIVDLTDRSNYDRLCMAEAGLRMVGERPLLGHGPGRVRDIYPLYRHPTAPRFWVPHLHNSYLDLAAERGIPALSVLLALLVTALVAAARGFRRGGGDRDLHLGAFGAMTAFATAALFENNWGDTEVQRVVLFLLAIPFLLAPAARTAPVAPDGISATSESAP